MMTPPSSSVSLGFEGDKVMSSKSLASTLQKMYAWERKLYHEVRVCSCSIFVIVFLGVDTLLLVNLKMVVI